MLIQFNFKNFRSFRDDATLDMTATKITEFNSHVISVANEKLLPVAAIFGANASGKSNVFEAFKYMAIYVIRSFYYGDEADNKTGKTEFAPPTPFLFDKKSSNDESSFEVYFTDVNNGPERIYNYGFSVTRDGISEEWLNYKSKSSRNDYKTIFYRNAKTLDLSGLQKKHQENIISSLNKETLIVSLGAKLKIDKLKIIRDWFLHCESVNFGNPEENIFWSRLLPKGFISDKTVQENVIRYFSTFDTSIIGFNVEELENPDNPQKKIVQIDSLHKVIDSDETASISLREESAGTLKMFSLYPVLQDVLKHGSVLFIDELNARLHPLLVRAFMIAFLDPSINTNHAQLIFTSHDSWQLNSQTLRRDEIWFVEKDINGISSLYSLVDFEDEAGAKIRKDENYEKNYLLGKYGAIPSLNRFDLFEEKL